MTTTSSASNVASSVMSTLGAGSGIDIQSLAKSLVEAERAPRKELIDKKITQSEAKISAYGAVKYALSQIQAAFGKLNDTADFRSLTPAVSPPGAFTATASAKAPAGSHEIKVLQIAQAQRNISPAYASPTTPLNGGAPFTLTYNLGTEAPKEITVANPTPAGLAKAINDAGLGLSAQVVNTGAGHKVVVTGQTGADNYFSLVTEAPADLFASEMQPAQDARLEINGVPVTRTTNTVSDAIAGVTLTLRAPSTGSAATQLDLQRDTAPVMENLRALVAAYNDFEDTLKELGDPKSTVEKVGGALAGESLVMSVRAQVRTLISQTSSTPSGSVQALRNVGLSFDRYGKLQLDEAKAESAMQDNFEDVVQMFTGGTDGASLFGTTPAGAAGSAVRALDRMLRSTGIVERQTANANRDVRRYQDDLADLEERMQAVLQRYIAQFAVMESIVGESNSLRTSLTNTFKAMANTGNN